MAAADTATIVATTSDDVARSIDPCVFAPIEDLRPAGDNIRDLKVWLDLRAARPKSSDAALVDWEEYGDKVEQVLCIKSKDLQLAIFLIEARARTMGFAGVRDGLWMLARLIEKFAEFGLYPMADKDDPEVAAGPLYWLNDKFPEVLHELELTRSPAGPNYSLNYYIEATAPNGGVITRSDWDAAALAGNRAAYNDLLGLIKEAEAELIVLKQVVSQHYEAALVSFTDTAETLEKCGRIVAGFLQKLSSPGASPGAPDESMQVQGSQFSTSPVGVAPDQSAWGEFERLARGGQIDQALRGMATLAAAEPNGRIRFQRKLLLADLCMQTNRRKLCASILQELNEIIEKHKLESWETSDLVGGVWSRLVRCYRDKAAGTEDEGKESEFYRKLSRLDPWQALACGEPAKRETP